MTAAKIIVRDAVEDDVALIMSSWLRSHKQNGPQERKLTNTVYFSNHVPIVRALVARCPILVAELEGVRDEALGWVCYDEPDADRFVVHYVYVKSVYRKQGVAKTLLKGAGWQPNQEIEASHIGIELKRKQGAKWVPIINNPYLLHREAARLALR